MFRDNPATQRRTTDVPAYMIFLREGAVRDAEALAAYRNSNRDAPRDPNLKPLVVYGALEALEGEAPDGVVVLQFPSVEDAKAWYNSPGYQAAIPLRQRAAEYRAFIVEGL
jgi:uncharacterized protein (DUF1330 family)